LLAGEEWVALRADIGVNFGLGGPGLICVAARALDGGGCVHRVDISFHWILLLTFCIAMKYREIDSSLQAMPLQTERTAD
jgi:hypothetical protein